MKQCIYFDERPECNECTEPSKYGFRYVETKTGERHVFEMIDAYTLVFILKGEALVSCNEFHNVRFHAGEVVLWPMNSECVWETLKPTAGIVLSGEPDLTSCDKKILRENTGLWLTAVPEFKGLPIRPRLMEFLISVKNYLQDGVTCPLMYNAKQRELSILLRAYYPQLELVEFFIPTVHRMHDFETFVMNNYLKMKGVKEFVDLAGMNLSTFNRRFKTHFNESPYQWLMKQRSKHIYHALSVTDRSISSIAKEYHFSDASHFNRYCKAMFGAPPSKIRAGLLVPSQDKTFEDSRK